MKALQWIKFLEAQRTQYGKVLFRVAELANVAKRSRHALNVELARLIKNEILTRYANGVYGIQGAAKPEQLVPMLDSNAYITGMFALYRHNLITQVPTEITCFTNRRHNMSRSRETSLGKLVFICVSSRIYSKPAGSVLAPPEQALCDFVHMAKRQGLNPASLVTFRGRDKLNMKYLANIAKHYPEPAAEFLKQISARESVHEVLRRNKARAGRGAHVPRQTSTNTKHLAIAFQPHIDYSENHEEHIHRDFHSELSDGQT